MAWTTLSGNVVRAMALKHDILIKAPLVVPAVSDLRCHAAHLHNRNGSIELLKANSGAKGAVAQMAVVHGR